MNEDPTLAFAQRRRLEQANTATTPAAGASSGHPSAAAPRRRPFGSTPSGVCPWPRSSLNPPAASSGFRNSVKTATHRWLGASAVGRYPSEPTGLRTGFWSVRSPTDWTSITCAGIGPASTLSI